MRRLSICEDFAHGLLEPDGTQCESEELGGDEDLHGYLVDNRFGSGSQRHFGEPGRPMDHRYQHIDRPEVALEGSIPVLEVGSGFVLGPDGNRFAELICFLRDPSGICKSKK